MELKELLKVGGEKTDKKKPNKVVIWMIIAATVVLAFGSFGTGKKETVPKSEENKKDYAAEQEMRLEKILKKINGTGDVSVYIKFDDEGEAVTAKNEKSMTEEGKDSVRSDFETEIVVSDGIPYVVKEKTPQVSGVLVVAEGAANEAVRLKIFEAVKSLYGIAPHRIKVTY